MSVAETSRESHRINISGRVYQQMEIKVLEAIRRIGKPSTNLEISAHSGIPINSVTPRVNALVACGALEKTGRRTCTKSSAGRTAETVFINKAMMIA